MSKPRGGKVLTKHEQKLSEDEQRLRYRTKLVLIDKIFKLLGKVVGGATVAACFYFIYLAVDSVSGKTTTFNGIINAVGKLAINEWLAYAIAGVMGVAWYSERRLRRRTIKQQSKHIKELETKVAPERQSSGLQPDGRQREGDRDA